MTPTEGYRKLQQRLLGAVRGHDSLRSESKAEMQIQRRLLEQSIVKASLVLEVRGIDFYTAAPAIQELLIVAAKEALDDADLNLAYTEATR